MNYRSLRPSSYRTSGRVPAHAAAPDGALMESKKDAWIASSNKVRLIAWVVTALAVAFVLTLMPVVSQAEGSGTSQRSASADLVGTVPKSEVVYANLSATGQPTALYVVNIFESDQDAQGMVQDFGVYEEVTNLTSEEALEHGSDSIMFTMPEITSAKGKAQFSYQGKTASSVLPWNIKIRYELDGKEVVPAYLAGADGHVKISLQTSKNAAMDDRYFKYYALQVSAVLAKDKASDVSAEGGSLAHSGSDIQTTFMILPDREGDVSLEADVTDFSFGGISLAAVPLALGIDVPSSDEVASQFDDLIDATDQLSTGTRKIASGASSLASATTLLKSGTSDLLKASKKVEKAVGLYVDGVKDASEGAQALSEGSATYSANAKKLSASADQLKQATDAAAHQLSALQSGLTAEQAAALGSVLGADTLPQLKTLLENASTFASSAGTFADSYKDIDGGLDGLKSGLEELANNGADLVKGAQGLSSGAKSLNKGATDLTDGAQELDSGADEVASGASTLADESQGIPDKLQDELDEYLHGLDTSGFEPLSFMDERNTGITLVQFVMKTDAIEPPEQSEPEQAPAEEKGVLERFFALFE